MTEVGRAEPAVVDLADPVYWVDPHEVLARARRRGPVALTPIGERLLLRYRDGEALLRHRAFTARPPFMDLLGRHGIRAGPFFDYWRHQMATAEPRAHARLRQLVSKAFTPRRVDGLRPQIREVAGCLLDRAAECGRVDLEVDFARRLPSIVMCRLLGIPDADQERVGAWTQEMNRAFTDVLPEGQLARTDVAVARLGELIGELREERGRAPRDDLLTSLLQAEEAGESLSPAELVAMVQNLLLAGHDSTRSLLSLGTALFLAYPDQAARLRADPSLAAKAVEEVLRFEPPVGLTFREALEDVEIGDLAFRRGERVNVSILASNRDSDEFDHPGRFDIGREEIPHLSFGSGVHFCLGAALARAEAQEAFRVLVERLPGLRPMEETVRWVPFLAVRSFESLTLRVVQDAGREAATPSSFRLR